VYHDTADQLFIVAVRPPSLVQPEEMLFFGILILLCVWFLQNFKKERVHFEVPSPKEDYFHILVIHQNRWVPHVCVHRMQTCAEIDRTSDAQTHARIQLHRRMHRSHSHKSKNADAQKCVIQKHLTRSRKKQSSTLHSICTTAAHCSRLSEFFSSHSQHRAQKGVKNYIPTEMLPDFLNFIIWGHEHECRVKPEEAILSIRPSLPIYCSEK